MVFDMKTYFDLSLPVLGLDAVPPEALVFHSGVAKNSSGEFVTNGGRVLIAVARNSNLESAANEATRICTNTISFEGAQFRKDIGQKALKM